MGFKVYSTSCKNCLLSKDAIVSPERRKQLIKDIKNKQTYFVCHKSSYEGGETCCKNFFDKLGGYSQLIRIAERLNAVEFVEHEQHEKLPTYKEMNR